jgi:hypothetical protein
MVTTRSRNHQDDDIPDQNHQAGQLRTSTNPNGRIASLEDHMKRMSKDMETFQKQNADLISRLPLRRDRKCDEYNTSIKTTLLFLREFLQRTIEEVLNKIGFKPNP